MDINNTGGVYAITDCVNNTFAEVIEKSEIILEVGIALFQYRNKTTDKNLKNNLAQELQSLCAKHNTPFIVNDDLELATEIEADGIHLGKHDIDIQTAKIHFANKIIGISCYNSYEQAVIAEQEGASYIAFGAFFPSSTKPDALKADINLINKAKEKLTIPGVAIGGITPENGNQLINAKIDYLAVINGLYSTPNTRKAALAYKDLFIK